MKKIRALWQSLWMDVDRRVRLGRILGLLFLTAGFVIIGKAWEGSASQVRVDSQFPYLLSGGFMGLGLVVTGCTLLFLSTVRAERQLMTDKFDEMNRLLSRTLGRMSIASNGSGANTEQVVAGGDAYHRPDCTILKGKGSLQTISVAQASSEGLSPCRACDPPRPAEISGQTQVLS
ncbi:MAG: hypothetical protein ACLGHL_02020 [Actinomycetota bacterium]